MYVPLTATEINDRESHRVDALFQEKLRLNRLAINQWSTDEASRVDPVPTFQLISSPLGPLVRGWGPSLQDKKTIQQSEGCKQR